MQVEEKGFFVAILKVCRMGHPVLRDVAESVAQETVMDDEVQGLIDDMIETMDEYDGVGLAAPQVHVSQRIVVVRVVAEAEEDEEIMVLINPEIQPVGEDRTSDWEGCLSIPDLRGFVPRFKRIAVKALDGDGKPISFQAEGYVARVIQHEVDHLNGTLFLDRMPDMRLLAFREEYFRYLHDVES